MTKRAIGAQTALRVLVGFVFLVSGLLKFLYENQGPLRFARLGLPAPAFTAYAVGAVEVVGGALVIAGLFTRRAAVPLALDMVAALVTTKLPLLFGAGPEPVAALPKIGVLAFAYQARLDLTLLAACIYLVTIGSGRWSLDARFRRREPADALARVVAADADAPGIRWHAGGDDGEPPAPLGAGERYAIWARRGDIGKEPAAGSPRGAAVVTWSAPAR